MKKIYLVLLFTISFFLLISCGNDSSSKQEKDISIDQIIDIHNITGKSIQQVEDVLGSSQKAKEFSGYPCKETDECKKVFFQNQKFEVIFRNSKADRITINKTPDLTSNKKAILALGLPNSKPDFQNPTFVSRWENVQNIAEISFFPDYILVQVSNTE
jgi:uncharacterized membrane protein